MQFFVKRDGWEWLGKIKNHSVKMANEISSGGQQIPL
jgi:hypothetical protein